MKNISILIVSALMFLSLVHVTVAFGPTAAFPNTTLISPIHLGTENQEKQGGLSVGTFMGTLKAIFAGDVHIGNDVPANTYDTMTCHFGSELWPGCAISRIVYQPDLTVASTGGFDPNDVANGGQGSQDKSKYNQILCVQHSDGKVIPCPVISGACNQKVATHSPLTAPGQENWYHPTNPLSDLPLYDTPIQDSTSGIWKVSSGYCSAGIPLVLSSSATQIAYECLGQYGGTTMTGCDFEMAPTNPGIAYGPGTYTWVVPGGVNSINIQAWGAGGAGGSGSLNASGGGGGGGEYHEGSLAVTPGDTLTFVVGSRGLPKTLSDVFDTGDGGAGGQTTITYAGSVVYLAKGGGGGNSASSSKTSVNPSGVTYAGPGGSGAGANSHAGTTAGVGGTAYHGCNGGNGGNITNGNGNASALDKSSGGGGAGGAGKSCTNGQDGNNASCAPASSACGGSPGGGIAARWTTDNILANTAASGSAYGAGGGGGAAISDQNDDSSYPSDSVAISQASGAAGGDGHLIISY